MKPDLPCAIVGAQVVLVPEGETGVNVCDAGVLMRRPQETSCERYAKSQKSVRRYLLDPIKAGIVC